MTQASKIVAELGGGGERGEGREKERGGETEREEGGGGWKAGVWEQLERDSVKEETRVRCHFVITVEASLR